MWYTIFTDKYTGLDKGVDDMTDSEKLDLLLDKVGMIESKVTNIELTLENEIRTNIKRVAEGHLDLSRNLHDALKIDNEKEMLAIRVNIIESNYAN